MENTKNHGSQSHTKENANDNKDKKTAQQGKTGAQHNAGSSSGAKANAEDDDNSSSSKGNGKTGTKSGGSR